MRLLDGYLCMGKLRDFVPEVINLYGEEEQERICWEMWLHKCLDQSYTDFRENIMRNGHSISLEEQREIARYSFEMLQQFQPPEQQHKQ